MNNLPKLRANLTEYFSVDELELLCFDLGIDKGKIPGKDKGKDYFVSELLSYMQRRDMIPRLLIACCQNRPNVRWEDTFKEALRPPEPIGLQPHVDDSLAGWCRRGNWACAVEFFLEITDLYRQYGLSNRKSACIGWSL